MKKHIIIQNEDYSTKEIVACFDSLQAAEEELSKLQSEYANDSIIGYDDDYFQVESEYGNIITFQLFEINCD